MIRTAILALAALLASAPALADQAGDRARQFADEMSRTLPHTEDGATVYKVSASGSKITQYLTLTDWHSVSADDLQSWPSDIAKRLCEAVGIKQMLAIGITMELVYTNGSKRMLSAQADANSCNMNKTTTANGGSSNQSILGEMNARIAQISNTLPQKAGKDMTWMALKAGRGLEAAYYFRFDNVDSKKAQVLAANEDARLKVFNEMQKSSCADAEIRHFLDGGVVVSYRFESNSGDTVWLMTIAKKDCS